MCVHSCTCMPMPVNDEGLPHRETHMWDDEGSLPIGIYIYMCVCVYMCIVLRLSLSCVYAACLGLEEPQLAIAIASGPGMLVHVLYLAHPSSPG